VQKGPLYLSLKREKWRRCPYPLKEKWRRLKRVTPHLSSPSGEGNGGELSEVEVLVLQLHSAPGGDILVANDNERCFTSRRDDRLVAWKKNPIEHKKIKWQKTY
jgi:hypothetical protein